MFYDDTVNEKCVKQISENNVVEDIDQDNVIIVPEEINESFWNNSDAVGEITFENKTYEEDTNLHVEENPNLSLNIVS